MRFSVLAVATSTAYLVIPLVSAVANNDENSPPGGGRRQQSPGPSDVNTAGSLDSRASPPERNSTNLSRLPSVRRDIYGRRYGVNTGTGSSSSAYYAWTNTSPPDSSEIPRGGFSYTFDEQDLSRYFMRSVVNKYGICIV
ncbi:hypothetical protein MAPG_10629 [Magnaporthiopsis poae ATCC 64411]|uniref:Uncharacterized protein n=1 Tax=Magnaporthiopsis poae (strain ATCC 64411 / 73-15) TaxID=644358 RepID=A0A0C4ED36_MAGP6|nr:hypothetical protein MAPG_10629 [Magnaporthiopsis poae ATCC 64411]